MSSRRSTVEDPMREVADVTPDELASARPLRADARRNYLLLVDAARAVFAEQGGDASMEAIAKRAGVGIGTLYRHFPKRIDVVEAVYRTDVDGLVDLASALVVDRAPWPALVAWLEGFVRYAQTKRTFLSELFEAFEKNPELKSVSRERLHDAMASVLVRAQASGDVREDVDASDVMQLLGPMCTSPTLSDGQIERLLAVVEDGLRAPT
ncbi:MAG TPA: TetR/AcrR family transcriptional regulator [Acidimicrobiales bacterium]|jgi:AcrR family transcriptional regulator|nr:TetR/AcrR family transcriptional regulator [Acidimicrobiales bacterium]